MTTVTISREQILADKMKRVCDVARVTYAEDHFHSKWAFWSERETCRQKDGFSTLICERACLAKTQQIAKLLVREKITTKVNIIIAPNIWGVGIST